MFKYFGEILSKFTHRERILVLILLLISVVISINGDKLINSFKGTPDNIKERLIELEYHNAELNTQIIDLRNEAINNGIECTNTILSREIEIREEIRKLIDVGKSMTQTSVIARQPNPIILDNNDTIRISAMMSPIPIQETIITDFIKELEKIEKTIVKD